MNTWQEICRIEEVPQLGARIVSTEKGDIAIFRNTQNEVFALRDRCPHKGGPLSQGIVFGRKVACPLHGWNIELDSGEAIAPDMGCTKRYDVKVENSMVYVLLPGT